MIQVLTDSTADLTPAQIERYGIGVVPLHVLFGGQIYRDGVDIQTADLLSGIAQGQKMPTTSQPSPAEFAAAFSNALDHADEVLSLHIAETLSGTVGSARLAAQDFGGRVTVVDSGTVSMGLGTLAIRAAERAAAGQPLPEIVGEITRLREQQDIRFTVESLDYLRLNGRIGGATALLGGLLSIKPILAVRHGRVEPIGRERGQKKAMANIAHHAAEYVAQHGRTQMAFVTTPGGEQSAEELRASLQGLDIKDLGNNNFGSVVASHGGPGIYGLVLTPDQA